MNTGTHSSRRSTTGVATSSSASKPGGSSSAPEPTHPIFKEPANDVVLRSTDGQSFRFRRAYLEAASGVFDDLFTLASADGDSPRKKTADGPVVDLADEGQTLETFLLFVHPRAENPSLETLDALEKLCALADKYAALHVVTLAMTQSATSLIAKHAPEVFALALIYHLPAIASSALRAFDSRYACTKSHCGCDIDLEPEMRQSVFTLDDIPYRLVVKIPPAILIRLYRHQSSVVDLWTSRGSWGEVAEAMISDKNWFGDCSEVNADTDARRLKQRFPATAS